MKFDLIVFAQLTINGLLLGGLYAAMTLGFSTIWGVMRQINLAHGEFIMMGAFVAWFFYNPTREQSLVIAGGDPAQSQTTILLVLGFIVLGIALVISEGVLEKQRFPNRWQRRGLSLIPTAVAALALYRFWFSAGLPDIDIPMMTLVLGGLALSLGFMLSHLFLPRYIPNPLLRRALCYGGSVAVVALGNGLWQNTGYQPLDPFLILPVLFPLFFALGYQLQKLLLNRLVEASFLTTLLVSFSIAIILQNIGLQIYAADPRRINVQYGTAINLGGVTLPPTKIFTILVAILMVGGLVLFFRRTRTGYAIRAAAQSKFAARLMGIDIYETYAITFGISIALTALAGAMMGAFLPIAPINGPPWTLRAFSIVALGGLGKVEGVVTGGLVLGLAESYIGGYISAAWAIAAAFLILVIVLLLRPQGITGGLLVTEEG